AGGEVDDAAALCLDHDTCDMFYAEKGPNQIYLNDFLEHCTVEGYESVCNQDTGAVDKCIDTTVPLHRFRNQSLPRCFVGHVMQSKARVGAELFCKSEPLGLQRVGDDDVGALLGKKPGN